MAEPQPTPTSFMTGQYEVRGLLGEGGTKKVYLAHDTVLDRDVAFCIVKSESFDPNQQRRVLQEARAIAKLGGHPNVVPIYEFGKEGEQLYMVLPMMAGGSVEELIRNADDGQLELETTIQIATDVCHGLDFAHRNGIIHRDIKPGNVWLTEDDVAQIGDFGLAVSGDFTRFTEKAQFLGTVAYSSPEMISGGEIDQRTDLYSLGVMLYEMVTGVRPFRGEQLATVIGQHLHKRPTPPSDHNPQCPTTLGDLILELLSKEPSDRPGFAGNVVSVLENLDTTSTYQLPPANDLDSEQPGAPHEADGEPPSSLESLELLSREQQQRIRQLEDQNQRLHRRLDRALRRGI